ncbi:MAG: exosortase/archaeosortase family protein [Planctomycetes bacterium]|nr:exosortase/archaeosortase family protein [Planctomycetota bacterium]
MTAALKESVTALPSIRVDVVEPGVRTRRGWERCELDRNLQFSTASLESYFFAQWEPALYDALLVAAGVEFCDRTQRRPVRGWGREIELRIPVHAPDHWNGKDVSGTLHETLDFLTGDRWSVTFYARRTPLAPPRQGLFSLPGNAAAVMPLVVTGLHTEAQAVVIDYLAPGGLSGQLNVEEACSGMRLMMAFVTLGVAMAYLGDRPAWQRVIMVVFCVPIAVFCNTIRVTMTGLFLITGRTELAQGTPHQLLGIAMLVLALGMFALVGYVLANLFVEVTDDAEFADA